MIASAGQGIATLRVPNASERDIGTYTCQATSEAGIMEHQFLVEVTRGDGGTGDFIETGK